MAGKKQPAPPKKSIQKGGATKSSNSTSSPHKAASSSRTHKPDPSAEAVKSESKAEEEQEEELRRQQTLLNIFSNTFRDALCAPDFGAQLQEVKSALFNRDFGGAFAREAALDVYAARWSPTRALCYGRVLRRLDARLRGLVRDRAVCADRARRRKDVSSGGDVDVRKGGIERDEHARDGGDESRCEDGVRDAEREDQEEAHEVSAAASLSTTAKQTTNKREEVEEGGEGETRTLRVLAIGGAAAEIVAFADYISDYNANSSPRTRGEITLLDIGPWGTVVQRLQTALTTPPPQSRYTSAATTKNKALVPPESLHSAFLQKDILSLDRDELAALLSTNNKSNPAPKPEPVLITLLFTLNELYTTGGMKRTTSFLRLLSALVAPGSLLLVVDSPGSYAEAAVGKDARRYPMQWLLDHTLVPPAEQQKKKEKERRDGKEEQKEEEVEEEKNEENPGSGAEGASIKWEMLESHDSVWFRLADGLRYLIPLENMRYQMHLYRAYVG
ncbi:hypothetical protein F5B17DRAFT_402187 [Nemania serpens]|nr:hypothetical protein F5B17DRAFT_402187 [Nemania serpens]